MNKPLSLYTGSKMWLTVNLEIPFLHVKQFKNYVETTKELKPIVRAIQTTKTNNTFRFIDSGDVRAWKKSGLVKARGNHYEVHKDLMDKLNLHEGERIVFDSQDPMGLMSRGTARNLQPIKDEKGKNTDFFRLTRAFKPIPKILKQEILRSYFF